MGNCKNFIQFNVKLYVRRMCQQFSENKKKLLLNYSDCENRATIADSDISEKNFDYPIKKEKKKKRQNRKGLLIRNGNIVLHISGYKGLQTFEVAELVYFIPVHNLKLAGEKLLRSYKQKPNKKKKKNVQPKEEELEETPSLF